MTDAQVLEKLLGREYDPLVKAALLVVERLTSVFDSEDGLKRNLARLDLVIAHRDFFSHARRELP